MPLSNGGKKEIRTVQSRRSPFPSCADSSGQEPPEGVLLTGYGGVPALRPTKGAPNLRMSIPAWSMTGVYPASARPAEAVSVHPVSRVGQTNSELSASSCRGRLPCGSRSLDPAATFPYPEGWGMPASCACQLEAFRSVPFDRFRHRPLSGERATAHTDAPMLPRQRRPRPVVGCLFRSGSGQVLLGAGPHPFSGCLFVRGRRGVAFATPVRWSFDHIRSGCPLGSTPSSCLNLRGGPSAEALGCRC